MKATGIIRRMDCLGRFSIPAEYRKALGLNENDPLDATLEGQAIILRPSKCVCRFCGEDAKGGVKFRGTPICAVCVAEVKKT